MIWWYFFYLYGPDSNRGRLNPGKILSPPGVGFYALADKSPNPQTQLITSDIHPRDSRFPKCLSIRLKMWFC
jgi:hypothetical protein